MEFSLCSLMYSSKPRLPIDLYFDTHMANLCTSTGAKFIQELDTGRMGLSDNVTLGIRQG